MINYKNKELKKYQGFLIYKITNPNGLVYIGATTNLKKRLYTYQKNIKAILKQVNLYKSIKKWGSENHKVSILYRHPANEPLSIELMNILEQKYIFNEYINNRQNLLNIIIKGVSKSWRDNEPLEI